MSRCLLETLASSTFAGETDVVCPLGGGHRYLDEASRDQTSATPLFEGCEPDDDGDVPGKRTGQGQRPVPRRTTGQDRPVINRPSLQSENMSHLQRRYALIARVLVVAATTFPFVGCSAGTDDDSHPSPVPADAPFGAPQSSAAAANGCIDSTSTNLTFQDLIDLGLQTEGTVRPLLEPILSAMAPGSYAKFVSAVCADIPNGARQDFGPHGGLANHAAQSCAGLNGSITADDLIRRFAPSLEGDAELSKWNVTYSHALADYFCPTRFKK